jgi:hypothetical protein
MAATGGGEGPERRDLFDGQGRMTALVRVIALLTGVVFLGTAIFEGGFSLSPPELYMTGLLLVWMSALASERAA